MLEERKKTFNNFAGKYEKYRPDYPAEMYDDLVKYSALKKDDSLLEIGCGTGKATEGFLQRGFERITCIEYGDNLAEFTRDKFSSFKSLEVLNEDFEKWQGEKDHYSLIYCATAFHFLNPEIAYTKMHEMLKENGTVAIFWNMSMNNGNIIYEKIKEAHLKIATDISSYPGKTHENSLNKLIEERCDEINKTQFYKGLEYVIYKREIIHTADDYIELISTHSPVAVLKPEARKMLLCEIKRNIEENGGIFRENMITTCYFMQKK